MSGPCLSSSVADHPLRPATRLSLGEPLPRQQADRPRTSLSASGLAVPDFSSQIMRFVTVCGINSPFDELFNQPTGVFDKVRALFAETSEAKVRGYQQGRFSFNVKGGRCENCSGDGTITIEMNFLPDVYVPCEVCHGARYNRETLEVRYKGKTIAEVLDMPIEIAHTFFESVPTIARYLKTLCDVGLGYVRLGQSAPTLSGGEAQRVKLATELQRRSTGRTIYVLDEPTTGLHFEDVNKLLGVLKRLVESGNTVIVIEHNLDVIKSSDWVIDMGPEGGFRGGKVVAEGTPEDVAKVKGSYTGEFLAEILATNRQTRKSAK